MKELYEKITNEDGSITYKPYDIQETTIKGYKIDEIIEILNGLEIERITEIKMVMENLSYIFKKVTDEQNKRFQMRMKEMFVKE